MHETSVALSTAPEEPWNGAKKKQKNKHTRCTLYSMEGVVRKYTLYIIISGWWLFRHCTNVTA